MIKAYDIECVIKCSEQSVEEKYKKYIKNKNLLIKEIEVNVRDNADEINTEYLEIVTKSYDRRIYVNSIERSLKNKAFVSENETKILDYIDFFDKRNIEEAKHIQKENIEVLINSLHINNDKLVRYIEALMEKFNRSFKKEKTNCWNFQEIIKGENNDGNDKRNTINIFEWSEFTNF